ncbi:shikimate dehydrogenase family protein [Falsiporphyromonas endometrii]|uniref:Shikimate dehydrogenase family protein n=1 Tax=Falsiporphyromonas endometrii TaxID=1387297 RepID=A0ABV9K9L2_9PORP|nr:shikimate dehydrogenase [Porphyromonadaceae bacterium]
MIKFGLIGNPVEHSASADYFNKKFEQQGSEDRYELFQLSKIEELEQLLDEQPHLIGLNVTSPFKVKVINYLDTLDEEAEYIGAVNTIKIVNEDGIKTLKGYNTDVIGFAESIRPYTKGKSRALVLGTGGAAMAVVRAFDKLYIETTLVSRNPQKEDILSYEDLHNKDLAFYDFIVNATPVGMDKDKEECPQIDYSQINSSHICYDLIYNPEKTLFLEKAEKQGAKILNGIEMLYKQAEEAYLCWTK